MALSPSVAARHSRTPVSSERSAAGDDPVPGLLNDEERGRAAERRGDRVLEEPVGLRVRGDPRVGVDVDRAGEDQHPGRVDRLARVRRAGRSRSASTASIRPPRIATSARRDPSARTTVPPVMRRSGVPVTGAG